MRYKSVVLRFRACKTQPILPSKVRSKSTPKLKTASNFQYSTAVKTPFYQVLANLKPKRMQCFFAEENILQLEEMELVNVERIYLR